MNEQYRGYVVCTSGGFTRFSADIGFRSWSTQTYFPYAGLCIHPV